MVVLQLLGNKPSETNINIFGAGGVLLGTMLVLAFGTYVYSNVVKSPHQLYLQVPLTQRRYPTHQKAPLLKFPPDGHEFTFPHSSSSFGRLSQSARHSRFDCCGSVVPF